MQNSKLHIKIQKFYFLLLVFSFLLLPLVADGAILYLSPSSGEYHQGDTFIVEVRIDTEDECINTVKIDLSFSKEILEFVDFSKGNSILTLWLEEPTFSMVSCNKENVLCGLLSFTGGIPGGYCGILPGEPGKPNLLGKIIFKALKASGGLSSVILFFGGTQVLLNDGLGTPAKLTTKGAIFTILPGKTEPSKDEWQEELEEDIIPPEPFEIEIHQNPAIFEGKYFITFSTTDKQTGLGYYEVKEGEEDWEKATSPHLLKDQSLSSIIKVRAADKAGNEQIAEYIPPKKPFPYWLIILILVGIGVIIWIISKTIRKR